MPGAGTVVLLARRATGSDRTTVDVAGRAAARPGPTPAATSRQTTSRVLLFPCSVRRYDGTQLMLITLSWVCVTRELQI